MNKRLTAVWAATLVLVLVLCVIDLMSGRTSIGVGEIFGTLFCGNESDSGIRWLIRTFWESAQELAQVWPRP